MHDAMDELLSGEKEEALLTFLCIVIDESLFIVEKKIE